MFNEIGMKGFEFYIYLHRFLRFKQAAPAAKLRHIIVLGQTRCSIVSFEIRIQVSLTLIGWAILWLTISLGVEMSQLQAGEAI